MTKQDYTEEPVAIVGSSCRFPGGSSSPSKLWDLPQSPRDVLREFDPERMSLKRFYHHDGEKHGSTNVINKSYTLEEDSRLFDASFFGITPMEAAGMDPQQRQLLETVYEAFESAGITLEQLKGSLTSVHVGVMTNDWTNIQLRDPETLPQYSATGTANSIMSNRISYIFDLKGPSVTLDTACSSSLVALHHATRGLLDNDSATAVVAGVNIILDPTVYITESKLHMLSPDARSRMWDKGANGYARGEGTAALVLKTLSRALADGDHIEGIIRGSGVNSDGQSPGITMPFAPTQAALIRNTYRRAGLDPVKDRPQYFECHGTGTPAGDPIEARAVSEAFATANGAAPGDEPMYVGSIKTVIGHLEGCAGLAGVMKALLAIKHRTIPPNLHFNELNPAIAPFYGPLRIPTTTVPWPKLASGAPARVSVNSFGFGGTNAHAIIESFEDYSSVVPSSLSLKASNGNVGPLLFSAATGQSLLHIVQGHLDHLKAYPSLDLSSSRDIILANMEDWVSANVKTSSSLIGYQPRLLNPKELPGVLGVFTGQGAQWPAMGRELIVRSPLFRKSIEECEAVLRALPADDAPTWSLVQELMADASSSRIDEAAISQPLCTAVQLGLVDVLSAAGVRFDAVIGHSSGEIAAVYASGIINRAAAVQIAYYRGLHARLAQGANGQRGGMLAAGLSLAKAMLFCSVPQFEGRLRVAASNAPQTVTLSGDIDAIREAKQVLDADGVFARALKIDTAYHSHHMEPCAEPYLQSLLACNIEVKHPAPGKPIWSSSVRGDTELLKGDLGELKGPYWVSNMVRTVLFSQAVESSIWHGGPFDLGIEVGPHPALKGPVEQTLKAVYGSAPLYTGVLKRGSSDVEAFSTAIGTAWAQLGPSTLKFTGYRAAFYEAEEAPVPRVPKNLPTYSWEHDKVYWRESATSRRYRTGQDAIHELLGRRSTDDNNRELRWRNLLRLHEIPWLRGHEVLGEVLLPAAAYVSLAIEAGQQLAKVAGRDVSLFEVENVDIMRPVVVPDNKEGVETVFTVRLIGGTSRACGPDSLQAQFSYYVCVDQTAGTMVHVCNGDIVVHLGELPETGDVLPPRDLARIDLVDIECDRVYNMFQKVGLHYTGPFQAMAESKRVLGYSSAKAAWPGSSLADNMVMHPAMLDVAFQTLFVALAHPASGQVTSALLPSRIDRVRVSPLLPKRSEDGDVRADFESWVVKQTVTSLIGDLNVYDTVSGQTLAKVEGLALNMVGEQDSSRDRPMFAKTVWTPDIALGLPGFVRNDSHDAELLHQSEDFERVALYYARRLAEETADEDRSKFQWYHQRMLEANDEQISLAKSGQHPVLRREWLTDGPDVLCKVDAAHPGAVQLQLLHALGNNYPSIVRGEMEQLKVMMKDDMINRFFTDDLACVRVNQSLADVVRQISFKYPRANILEIGGGAGGTAWSVLNNINDAYASYTFTDISSLILSAASEKFTEFASKMLFKTLDINNDPATQEFVPHSYDIIIASNTLHVTKNLERTMHHVRSMLRPGGYLLVFETTGVQNLSKPFMFSGLPTWWPGQEADRQLRPIVSTLRWEEILNNTGFSGLDVVVHDLANEEKHTTALMISQAIDDQVLRLREPLNNIATAPAPVEGLTLIGGKKLATTKILSGIQKLLPRAWRSHMRTVNSIDAIEDLATIGPGSDIICLHDFDETLFASTMTESRLASLQGLLMKARNVLWITSARNGKSHAPRASMFHGIARIAPVEMPHLNLQTLGLEAGLAPTAAARHCVEAFIRLRETGEASSSDQGKETEGGKLLWAPEPEVEVLKNGEVIIPRVVPDQALNEIFLASKRTITKSVDATDVVVQAVPGTARMTLQTVYDKDVSTIDFTSVQVQYALHIPARKGNGIYLVLGTTATTSSPVMTASEINASVVSVPSERVVAIASEDCTPGMLVATANRVLIGGVTTLASPGKPVLLYGAEASLAAELATELSKRDIHAYFASLVLDVPDAWIKLHERSSKRAIQRAVPHDIALYVDCLSAQTPTGDNLRDCLPPGCTALQLDAQLLKKIFLGDQMVASALLRDAYLTAHKTTSSTELNCKIIEVPALANSPVASLASKRYVTDWQKRDYLSVTVPPLDTHGLFQPDRTYLMVGAAGGLGLSLCKWILAHGVKHLVITSRKPNVDPAVLEDAQRMGASVHVLPMDVTDRQSIEKVVQQIRNTMPPIAGVCQCAMVLQDRLFLDMSIKEMNGTLAAKVDGTENLDAVFADEALDFFVMLSSSATIIGNIGQANYHIGNLFMTSLAAQRRARGLAGSVIHVGHITDVGYIVKAKERTDQLAKHFASIRMMPLSETDVHHAFAQAVRGGRPGSQVSPDIIMGIEPASKPIDPESTEAIEDKIHWLANPRLSHMTPIISLHGDQQGPGQGGASAASSVRQRVEEAESEEEAVAGVVDAFCAKLDKTLQLPNGRAAENAQRAVIDLGIDSLVAVEIRNWFLKELGADVPVVKVLGGDSVIQICTTAARTVMARSMKEGEKKLKTNIDDNKTTAPVNPPAIVQANATPAHNGPLKSVSSNASTTNNQDELEDLTNASQDTPVSERTSIFKIDDNASSSSVSGEIAEEEAPDVRSKEESTLSKPEVIQEERMSRAQARIWFLSKHLSDPAAYNMVFHYRVNGPLNMMRLRHALQMTTHYHECLRMCFYQRVGDGNPMQGVMASSAYELEHLTEADNNDLQRTMTRFKTRVWDMETGRTMGVAVLSRGAETHDFIFGYHHIITDVVGWYFFLRDLDRAYRLQPLGKPCAISHLDYTRQELQQETAGIYNEQLEFWRAEFATLPDPLPLLPSASVRARPARQAQEQDRKKIQSEYRALSPEVVAAVKAASHQLRVSPFHFYLAVLQVFLAQQAGIEDVCVGLVDANWGDDERASCMVGCFVNVLPVQSRVAPRDSFAEVARTASRKALAAFAHAGVPFDVLLDALNAPRWADGDTPPLFQAAINYRAAGWGELPLGADCRLTLCLDDGKDAEPPYDISLGIMDMAEGCTIDLHCQGALYSAEATCKMADSYLRLVKEFATNPDLAIEKSSLHDESQITHAIKLGKGPEIDFGWPETLSQRFREMCQLRSAEPALIDGATTLSYAELGARVDAASKGLRSVGGITGDRIAVLCEPSADFIVAMLAVLQTGCVYVPLDTSLPASRHAAIVSTCEPSLLLYHASSEDNFQELNNECNATLHEMRIDDISDAKLSAEVPCSSDSGAPAVLLFTSGSTGTPKGITLSQGNFVNHLALKTQVLDLGQERVLQHSSLGFDMSLIQTFCALANGGCLVLASRDIRRDPVALTTLQHKHSVTLTIATPSEYLAWCRYGSLSLREHMAWRHACMGGEPVSTQLKRELRLLGLKELQLTNCYGPTEITAAATFQSIDLNDVGDVCNNDRFDEDEQRQRARHAVGKALPNYTVRILDSAGRPQPVQHTGEICIGGKGVAQGYLGLPSETRDKFIIDSTSGDRLYRTGDQGRLLSDGTLLCFGRLEGDTQVKLRGLRIELEEVETAVLEAGDGLLSNVVVSLREDVLIAHATVSPTVERADNDPELTNILRRVRLPQYFIPAAIIVLPALPANANGKLDRKTIAALPLPAIQADDAAQKSQEVNMNIREGELRLLWERVLPSSATTTMGPITPASDFFLHGGNSMLLMRLQAAIRESMGVDISTRALYRASTLAAMAEIVWESREAAMEDLENINWTKEAAVPDWLKQRVNEILEAPIDPKMMTGGLEVVLTGATGFLGGRILHTLVQSPAVRRVHCIAIEADDINRLPKESNGKVRAYTGSLADRRLGLTANEHALLEQTADVIIHAGSNGHCLNNYPALQAPNVAATHQLAAMALPRAVPLLFVSSNRVSLLSGNTEQPPMSMADYKPPIDGREGLTGTKWAGEVFLENLNKYYHQEQQNKTQQKSWSTEVHRPCIVVGDQAPNSDSMNAILRFSLLMRCVPLVPRGRGFIDFKSVDEVAEEIVSSALQMARGEGSGGIQFKHNSSGTKVPIDGFCEHLEKVYGGYFEAVEMREWICLASKAGIDPLITAYLDGVMDTDEEMVFPYLGA